MNETHAVALLKKLQNFVILSDFEKKILIELYLNRRIFLSGQNLVIQGQSDQSAYFLIKGWICSYKIQIDGDRQIIDFQIPGDFIGLRSVLLRASDHSF